MDNFNQTNEPNQYNQLNTAGIMPRNIGLCVVFSIITCGIYSIYWFIKIHDEVNQIVNDTQAVSGGMAFILTLITCGIYGWYWAYKIGEKVDYIKGSSNSSILFIVLQLLGLGIVNYCIIQDAINGTTRNY